jgi:hypothetical protein
MPNPISRVLVTNVNQYAGSGAAEALVADGHIEALEILSLNQAKCTAS